MIHLRTTIVGGALLGLAAIAFPAKLRSLGVEGDSEIKKRMIRESISEYPKSCPCPYNTARNGSRCGGRSAYSRRGGYSPLCFESDITQEMLADWKRLHSVE